MFCLPTMEMKDKKKCILLINEVYINYTVTCYAGSIFGKADNKPNSLATNI